jgi:hypothetical protein
MKKIFFIILIFCSCKKETEQKTWFDVKDNITGTSIKGAAVSIFKCDPNDPWCGLIAWQSATTGDDGRCSFSTADYNRVTFTNVSKSDYWGTSGTRNTLIRLYPEGWMRLRIVRGTAYPPSSILSIRVYCGDPNYTSSKDVSTAADSSILIRCFGGQLNRVDWSVRDAAYNQLNSGTWNQQVPRLDSIAATLNY